MKIYMEKSMQRLLSVILALVLAVGLFLSVTSVHAAEDDVQAYWEAVEAYYNAETAFWDSDTAFWGNYGELFDSEDPLTEAQWNSMDSDRKALSSMQQAVITAHDNLEDAYDALTDEEKEYDPEPDDPEIESPSAVRTEVNTYYPDVQAWEYPELPESPYLRAFWDTVEAYYNAETAFWDSETAFWDNYGELFESEDPPTEAQWNSMDSDRKALSSMQQAVITAHDNLEAAYDALPDEEKEYDPEPDDPEIESPSAVRTEVNTYYPNVQAWEIPELPQSPYLRAYLVRLDAEDGIYALIGSAGDAMVAFDEANDAYQEELSKENPDSDTLDSLYETAMEKYTEFTAAKDAVEAEYDALKALYNKIPAEEKTLVYEDGNGVSIEWNSLTEQITILRSDMAQKEEPVKNVTVEEDIQPGTPSTKLVYTDKEALLDCIGLTDEEKSSASIEVVFHVASKTITPAEAITAAAKMPENYEVGTVLDLSMQLNIHGTKARDITETDSPISVSVTIPQNLINTDTTVTRTYKIIRIHDNVASVLDGTYNPQDNSLTFSTDCFSTYVIIYKDEKTNTANTKPSGNTGTTNTEQAPPAKVETTTTSQTNNAGTTVNAVNTGDETPLDSIFAIMIASLVLGTGCIGFNVWQRKKNPVK